MTLREFYDALDKHDWDYNYSDDHTAYMKGFAREKELCKLARLSPQHQSLFERFSAWKERKQKTKPRRPQ